MQPNHTLCHAEAHLEQGRYSWIWVVPQCPYCGHAHEHYAGPLDKDPTKYLGYIEHAHCPKAAQRTNASTHPAVQEAYVLEEEVLH